jgi:hypothetical protein
MKTLSQDNRPPDRDLNFGPLKYEVGMLITRLQGLVSAICISSCNN